MDQYTVDIGKSESHEHANVRGSFLRNMGKFLLVVFVIGSVGGGFLFLQFTPSDEFTPNTLVTVPSGYSLNQISALLKHRSIIRNQTLFSILVTKLNKETGIPAGDYLFMHAEPAWVIAQRLAQGDHGIETHRVTLPEGVTIAQMADILSASLPEFRKEEFIQLALPEEGYLFPDTYFFYSTATSGPIVSAMKDNFIAKTKHLKADSDALGEVWADVVNLASIVEKEAATAKDRRIVAGILKQRIARGMRLQVDAPFLYTIGKGSLELSKSDLADDSPYNTYRHEGLPPTPIANPGADAILSVLHPEVTEYLYYLSDKNGIMYYAKTFTEHKLHKATHLKP